MPSASARRQLSGAVAGVVSAGAAVGAGQLVAALVAPTAGPVVAVGSALVDLAPGWAKHLVIDVFGTGDKPALLIAVGVVVAALSVLAGVLEVRRPPVGTIVVAALGLIAVVAALTRHAAGPLDAAPAVVSAIVVIGLLRTLVVAIPRAETGREPGEESGEERREGPAALTGPTRRGFLLRAAGIAVLGAAAGVGGLVLTAGSRTVVAARAALRLPRPATALPAPPAEADLRIRGLAPVVTPNSAFYRIDTALQIPQIDPARWTLRITGMVRREITVSWAELLALPLEESDTTLVCVSNEVGGDLIGNARWLGYPIRHLLARAQPSPDADMVLSTSQDGFTAGTPLEALTDPDRAAILAVGMNGEPLPLEHGFPVRMVVPGLYGYVSATKWVVKLEVTRFDRATAYWTGQGWAERGPVKLESRIDVARPDGDGYLAAGVAWHQHVGVEAVEVRVDDGPWLPAELATAISADTWVQWRLRWRPEPGDHVLAVRAIGADGEVQTAAIADVLPDGATGYDTRRIRV
ncbi:molybdopterin-dependent oxidoreductase [Pseudolysinimonas sp.]|uniref:molybdopterin-dependent oxidoreductase n=1 Tax=Pseudolysinimonas sp. TaxID=2680009 RepID=UPI003F7FB4E4